jgi:hypothetical protein
MSSEKTFQEEFLSFLEARGVAATEDAGNASHPDEEVVPG